MKFFNREFFSKCDQIRRKLRIWSHLLKKSLMESFIFCVVSISRIWGYFIWDKVFNSGPSKNCGRQPLKYLKGYDRWILVYLENLVERLFVDQIFSGLHSACFIFTYYVILFVFMILGAKLILFAYCRAKQTSLILIELNIDLFLCLDSAQTVTSQIKIDLARIS